MADVSGILEAARTITLVDWTTPEIPRTLVAAGFTVTSVNRSTNGAAAYSVYSNREDVPEPDGAEVYAPQHEGDGYMVIRRLDAFPATADIVNVSRPDEELPDIARLAMSLGASAMWVEPEGTSAEARRIVELAGGVFIDGVRIVDVVRGLRTRGEAPTV